MAGIKFDIEGARKAGFTDPQIADRLAQEAKFDASAARAAGFKDVDIISRLTQPTAPTTPTAPTAPTAPTEQREVEVPGVIDSAIIGAGRTTDRIVKGMQQIYYGATGNQKAQDELAATAAEDDKYYGELQKARPFATGIGEALPSMVIPVGGAATAVGTAARVGAAAAVPAALEYGSVKDRAINAATSGAGAVVGGVLVPKAASAVYESGKGALKGLAGNITPEALALAKRAKELGITVNAAQLGDSKFLKTLASAIEQMPFTGGAKANSKHAADFTRAVSKTFGDDVDKITPVVYAANRQRLGKQFDDIAIRNTLNVDDALMSRLEAIASEANQMAGDDTIKAVDSTIARLLKQSNAAADMTGGKAGAKTLIEVPGAAYSSIDSMLSKNIKAGGEKGNYLKEVQKALREAMDLSISEADQEAWKLTRNQYKNLKAVRDIVARDAGDGNVPPMQLLNALNNSEAGKEAMAMGSRGTLGELGRIGRQFVRDPVPNSGTAQRAMAMGLIGGGGYAFGADPLTIAGMLAGGATAGRTMNKILMSPKVVKSLGEKGITIKELMKMPPSRIKQIIGGTAGIAAAEAMEN